jgi:hypothetical protein
MLPSLEPASIAGASGDLICVFRRFVQDFRADRIHKNGDAGIFD